MEQHTPPASEGWRLEAMLAGQFAHHLNNLLVAVEGGASLIREGLIGSAPEREGLAWLERAADAAEELTRQLLAMSGRGRFVVTPCELPSLIDDALGALALASLGEPEFLLESGDDLPVILADREQLKLLLLNLASNSVDALEETGGEITVSIQVAADPEVDGYLLAPGRYVAVAVTDTGPGMDGALLERCREPFFTTRAGRLGLGLSAAQGIALAHNGALRIQSSPGQGTRVEVLLPTALPEVIDSPTDSSIDSSTNPPPGRTTVLVVDDNPVVREVTARLLERGRLRVLTAAGGVEAIERLLSCAEGVDAALLDLMMPGIDGAHTFRALRRLRPDLPILLVSGYDPESSLNPLLRGPRAAFLQKPFRSNELLASINALLEQRTFA